MPHRQPEHDQYPTHRHSNSSRRIAESSDTRPAYLDAFGMHIPSLLPPINPQGIALLRLLGRLEFMTTIQIAQTVFPTRHRRHVRKILTQLQEEGLIWRINAPYMVMPPQINHRLHPPLALPWVWGLTTDGKALLTTIEAEPDQHSLQMLKARDSKEKRPSKLLLTHDLQVSWWCSSLLIALRRNAYVRSIFVQVEFPVHERQRIDAVVIIRMTRAPYPIEADRWPFFDGTPRGPHEIDVRLALEVDRGTEPLTVLLAKGATYRDLHGQGTYLRAVGGPIVPVFLAPTNQRAGQIAREWREIWPDGWGVIATPAQATHPTHGTLWGQYRTLNDATPCQLLTAIDQHPITSRVTAEPLLSLDAWQAQDRADMR